MKLYPNRIGNVLHLVLWAETPEDEKYISKSEASLPCVPAGGLDTIPENIWHRSSLSHGDLIPEQDINQFHFYLKLVGKHSPIPA